MIIFSCFVFVLFVYILIRLLKFTFYQWQLYKLMKAIPGPKIANPLTGNIKIFQDIVGNKKNVSKSIHLF